MSPYNFWNTFMKAIFDFVRSVNLYVYVPLVNTIVENPILLIVFGFMILGIIIEIFKRMII